MSAKSTPYSTLAAHTPRAFDAFGVGYLPGILGIEMVVVEPKRIVGRIPIRREVLAPHGYLHGGTLVSVADTMCGYGTIVNLPKGASGFVTIELKSNFLGTLREGALLCEATPVHLGGSTHVWDAVATDEKTGRPLVTFRCTQMILREERRALERAG